MDDEADDGPAGLYVTDAEIIRRLGYGESAGRRILGSIQKLKSFRAYPPKDPLFAGRRFWPAVLKWHLDYHRVAAGAAAEHATSEQPLWQENFDATPSPRQTRRIGHARPQLVPAQ